MVLEKTEYNGTFDRNTLKPKVRRLAVYHARESIRLSERKACWLVNISASVYCHRPKQENYVALRQRQHVLSDYPLVLSSVLGCLTIGVIECVTIICLGGDNAAFNIAKAFLSTKVSEDPQLGQQ